MQFTVTETGLIKSVKILESLNPILDTLAYNAILNMPEWAPTDQKNKSTVDTITLSFKFAPNEKVRIEKIKRESR